MVVIDFEARPYNIACTTVEHMTSPTMSDVFWRGRVGNFTGIRQFYNLAILLLMKYTITLLIAKQHKLVVLDVDYLCGDAEPCPAEGEGARGPSFKSSLRHF